ncbi:MAG: hypothetical protein KDE53_23340 [Caldilineaceae bacterium]|nr:hypothetical protein [Caldilineaceae bacterium]
MINQRQHHLLRVTQETAATTILAELALPPAPGLVVLNGGTADLEAPLAAKLRRILQDGLARVVTELGLLSITGGTDAGIFQLFGQGLAQWGDHTPCVGVAVAPLVTWPGRPDLPTRAEATLEPHHSHYVLVAGSRWGDETATMYALVAQLSEVMPMVTIFAGGGNITIEEMLMNVRQERTMILLAGSGRATDQVLAARAGAAVDDERLAQVAAQGRITPFALDDDPAAFMGLVRELLGLS